MLEGASFHFPWIQNSHKMRRFPSVRQKHSVRQKQLKQIKSIFVRI